MFLLVNTDRYFNYPAMVGVVFIDEGWMYFPTPLRYVFAGLSVGSWKKKQWLKMNGVKTKWPHLFSLF